MWQWSHSCPFPSFWQSIQPLGPWYPCRFWFTGRGLVKRSSLVRFLSTDSFKVVSSERTACSAAMNSSSLGLSFPGELSFLAVAPCWMDPPSPCDACTSFTLGFLWRGVEPSLDFLSLSSETTAFICWIRSSSCTSGFSNIGLNLIRMASSWRPVSIACKNIPCTSFRSYFNWVSTSCEANRIFCLVSRAVIKKLWGFSCGSWTKVDSCLYRSLALFSWKWISEYVLIGEVLSHSVLLNSFVISSLD